MDSCFFGVNGLGCSVDALHVVIFLYDYRRIKGNATDFFYKTMLLFTTNMDCSSWTFLLAEPPF
jgi:hypothetical protein